jgi:hypothetical protein
MPHRRLRRLIALFAVAALLLAVTVYGSHLHHPGGKPNETTHCDLCLQFGGTAGPSTATALPIRAALVVRLEPSRDAAEAPSREQPRSHRSRAPPFVA